MSTQELSGTTALEPSGTTALELSGTTALELSGTTALVTGASRGFGRAIAIALSSRGAHVVGVARDRARLEEVRAQLGDAFTPVAADATDPVVAGQLLDVYRPRTVVLNAGAAPLMRPVHRQTWQTFSRNWDVDVQHVFNWTREALLLPLAPGSVVIAISSGAAVNGSPLSGGYAGANATIRFIASYAATESGQDALGIRFTAVLPQLTGETDLGAAAVAAYAARQGVDIPAFLEGRGAALTLEQVGAAISDIATGSGSVGGQDAFLLTAAGLSPAP
jgi:NADP-dependent 3-hydroxy acid dehydrogenase YdfG